MCMVWAGKHLIWAAIGFNMDSRNPPKHHKPLFDICLLLALAHCLSQATTDSNLVPAGHRMGYLSISRVHSPFHLQHNTIDITTTNDKSLPPMIQ